MKFRRTEITKKRLTMLGVALLAIIGLWLILMPVMPEISFKIRQTKGFKAPNYVTNKNTGAILPKDNRISIPSIGLDTPVLEGNNESTVNQGVWRRPQSGSPISGGNTVLVGHRFRYFGDAGQVFYNLDKVNIGDEVFMVWNKKLYKYAIVDKRIVQPTETSVEAASKNTKLTLYTCTPIWTSKQRLVLIAVPTNKTI